MFSPRISLVASGKYNVPDSCSESNSCNVEGLVHSFWIRLFVKPRQENNRMNGHDLPRKRPNRVASVPLLCKVRHCRLVCVYMMSEILSPAYQQQAANRHRPPSKPVQQDRLANCIPLVMVCHAVLSHALLGTAARMTDVNRCGNYTAVKPTI